MDFNVTALNRLVDAIDRVTYAIQMTKTYADAHIKVLGLDHIVETSAVSGLLGLLSETTELISSITETSDVAGVLSSIDSLVSSIAEVAGADAALSTEIELISSIDAVATINARMMGVTVPMAGVITEESGIIAELDSELSFVGNIQSGTTVSGWLASP